MSKSLHLNNRRDNQIRVWERDSKTLQNFIYKHITDSKIVQKVLEKKGENLNDVKLAQTSYQNLSIQQPAASARSAEVMGVCHERVEIKM
jgi:hypothetical protein